jgi:ATP-dependent helicase HrpB
LLLARAWPERIGRREGTATDRQRRLVASYQLASGRRALLEGPDAEHAPAWLVVPEAEAGDQATVIRLFAAIGEEAPFERQLADMVHEEFTIEWNQWRPLAKRLSLVGQLQLSSRPIPAAQLPARQLHDAFERHLHTLGAADGRPVLPWPESALALLSRVRWAHAVQPERWPDLGEAALAAARPAWLHPHLNTTGGPVLDPATLQAAIEAWLGWQARQALDQAVPSHFQVPSGSRRPLEYPAVPAGAAPPAPILAVRIQEVFGMASQPCILGVPIQLHLLSPAQRPLQVTADLASFWSRTYPEIRKEMRGRYPRHYWPDNPLEAEATARAKPRGS